MCSAASLSVFAITLAGIDFSYRTMNSERLHRRLVSRQDSLAGAHAKPTLGRRGYRKLNHHLICGAGGICACPTVGLGEIPTTGAYLVTLVVGHLDADAVILAVELVVVGDIRDGVLIAQLVADVLKGLVKIVDVVRKESASAGLFGHVLQNLVAFGEMCFAISRFVRVGLGELNPLRAGADRIDYHAAALSQ